jgi:hypothetical protein
MTDEKKPIEMPQRDGEAFYAKIKLDALQKHVVVLYRLLSDREPGLATWQVSLWEAITAINLETGSGVSSALASKAKEKNPEHKAECPRCGEIISEVNIRFDQMPIPDRFLVFISCKRCECLLGMQIATKDTLFGPGRVMSIDSGGSAIPPGGIRRH